MNEQLHLNKEQLSRLGMQELIPFNDAFVKQLADEVDYKRPFRFFERIDRSDKHIICRVNVDDDFYTDEATLFYKFAKDRRVYTAGDMRISFYQVTCAEPVHFLAQ